MQTGRKRRALTQARRPARVALRGEPEAARALGRALDVAGGTGDNAAVLALAPLTMFAVGAAAGMDVTEGIPFLIIGVVLGIVAFLAARFGTWSKIVGVVLTLLAGFAGFWLAFGLMAPASPGDFLPGLLFVLGWLALYLFVFVPRGAVTP
jgi:uncharacterized membrane protein (UPF0136 family)